MTSPKMTRRRGAAALMLAALVACSLPAWAAAAAKSPTPDARATPYEPAGPWPQFQLDPQHSGALPEGPAPPYKQSWRFDAPGDAGVSGPVISGETVYAVGDTAVYALDLASGSQLWSVERASGPLATPAVASPSGGHGPDILLYLEGGGKESGLVALDTTTQQQLWSTPLEGDVFAGVALDGTLAFVGNDLGKVFAVDIASGDVAWSTLAVKGNIGSIPAVDGGDVLYPVVNAGTGELTIVALSEETGAVDWKSLPGPLNAASSSVAAVDGLIFAVVGGYVNGTVVGLRDGKLLWQSVIRAPASPASSSAFDGSLYVADYGGGIYGLHPETGKRDWDYQVNETRQARSSPVVSGGAVVVGFEDGRLVAVDPATGELSWEGASGGGSLKAIALAPGSLVVAKGGAGGGLVAFENDPAGRLLHQVSPTTMVPAKVALNFVAALLLVVIPAYLFGRLLGPRLLGRVQGEAEEAEEAGEAGTGTEEEDEGDGGAG